MMIVNGPSPEEIVEALLPSEGITKKLSFQVIPLNTEGTLEPAKEIRFEFETIRTNGVVWEMCGADTSGRFAPSLEIKIRYNPSLMRGHLESSEI